VLRLLEDNALMLRSCVFVLALLGSVASHSQSQQPDAVRLALVNVPDDVLRPLLPVFEQQHGRRASIVYTGNDPFSVGRSGNADLVIAHFGHAGVESFVTEGHGLWPKAVFANQMALIGPANDPAGVRGARTLTEAYRRIVTTKSVYLSNASAGARYVEAIALAGTDIQLPSIGASNLENLAAVRVAAERGAYVLWGVPPFLRWKRQLPIEQTTDLEPLVVDDPALQRMMVSIVVNPKTAKGVNTDAARAFQDFLLSTAIQARVAAFRYPDFDKQVWWPAGRHNSARD
jgi:tungstate transport system substrate-binding protein